jgi:flagellar biosynthesis/type III secretory pathway protein FliH
MKPIPIAQYLNRFERIGAGAAGVGEPPKQPPALLKPRVVAAPVEDIEARLHEAVERGRQEGLAAARAEVEAVLTRQQGEFEERAQAERTAFQRQEYAALADQISAGLSEVEARIAEAVAHILRPYLAQEQSKRVIQALSETLGRILSSESPALLKISGPEAVLDALRDRLSSYAVQVEYSLEDGVDVTIEAQQTVIRSQLQAWLDLIDTAGD